LLIFLPSSLSLSAGFRELIPFIAFQFISEQYNGMLVTEDDGTVIGIIGETGNPHTEMIKMMENFRVIRLPVCKDEKLFGVFSYRDIIKKLVEPKFMSNM
jgi:hypothetical protein